ncbi:MAG TPA: transporter [Chromatiales bacterium]|nr:transporter [Chromatiales bacterium]
MSRLLIVRWLSGVALLGMTAAASAHDPIFGIGPHVLYKGGVEIAAEMEAEKNGDEKEQALALQLTYGLTGDWALGIDVPYDFVQEGNASSTGRGDIAVFTKYRFWRKDSLGLQESAAVFLKAITDTAESNLTPALGKGATDTIVGFAYGYEGRKWYRWASARYRFNGTNDAGVDRGNKMLLDFVVGIRPTPTSYLEPDTVWLLELNGEFGEQADLAGTLLPDTGGTQWFLSPGIFWTKRNFAIKAGVQIPVYSHLRGTQARADYRARLIFELHL